MFIAAFDYERQPMSPVLPKIPASSNIALVNGRFYTVNQDQPWASALLVTDGKIAAVGDDDEILQQRPQDAEVVDLGGRMVMPGIHDAHAHLLLSGLKFHHEVRLTPHASPQQIIEDLKDGIERLNFDALDGWVIGGEYNPAAFPDGLPDRKYLDEAFPDRPIFLYEYSIHHGMANTRALELAGVTRDTPDPVGGRIVRRPDGEPTGELIEDATWLVKQMIPNYPRETYREAMKWAIDTCNRLGVTSIQEASAIGPQLTAMADLEASGELTAQITAHLVWGVSSLGLAPKDELEKIIDDRASYALPHVNTNFVKMILDGAPLPPHFTQANLTAEDEPDWDSVLLTHRKITDTIAKYDALGLTVKIHCAGQGSLRAALDAIEEVRTRNGDGVRHEIAHCAFVPESDLPRLGQLNVTAEMSPAMWHLPEYEASLGSGFKFADVLEAGALMTVGSDWIITDGPNLFPPLQGMLSRGDQSIDLKTALRCMTLDGARTINRLDEQGSLEVGKSADLIVLDRNLFDIPVTEIGQTTVLATIFEGRVVYQA